jgi:hypothetical protein
MLESKPFEGVLKMINTNEITKDLENSSYNLDSFYNSKCMDNISLILHNFTLR